MCREVFGQSVVIAESEESEQRESQLDPKAMYKDSGIHLVLANEYRAPHQDSAVMTPETVAPLADRTATALL